MSEEKFWGDFFFGFSFQTYGGDSASERNLFTGTLRKWYMDTETHLHNNGPLA